MRRRRLNVFASSAPWPGKDIAWRFELGRYDRFLVLAAEMLEVPLPDTSSGRVLDPVDRAALEDRLALAGLDVLAPASRSSGDIMTDGDLVI